MTREQLLFAIWYCIVRIKLAIAQSRKFVETIRRRVHGE